MHRFVYLGRLLADQVVDIIPLPLPLPPLPPLPPVPSPIPAPGR